MKYNPNLRMISESTNKKIKYSDGRIRIMSRAERETLRFSDAGFTLTETLVTLVIFVLIVVTVFSAYSLSHRAYQEGEVSAELTQNGRVILERMTREIRQAKAIASTDFPTTSTDATSTIEFEDGHDTSYIHYIRYFQDGTDIKREELAYYFSGDPSTYVLWNAAPPGEQEKLATTTEEAKIIGEYVASLGFWGSSIISVSTTLEKGDQSINLRTRVFRRNLQWLI